MGPADLFSVRPSVLEYGGLTMNARRSGNPLETRVRAFDIILKRSFSRGKFILASGRESDFYLDMKPTMFDPEGANLLSELVLQRLKGMNVDRVGGLEMGAVPLVTSVSMMSVTAERQLPGFSVRKAVKDHGTKKRIESAGDLKGKNVVILEDVTTTGGSAMEAVTEARNAGAHVVLVLSIVDRGEGAEEFFKEKAIPFDRLFHVREFLAATADQQHN
jgi:orotate phosphoribosyltransferase